MSIFYIIISATSTCQSATMTKKGDESDVFLFFCFSFSTRHAITEHIFLIIHNFRIFHLNNLKFPVKLLCTYMNNFPTASFLSVKLTQTLFLAKVRTTRTMLRIDLLLNKWYFLRVLKISNHFIHFLLRNDELYVKKNTLSKKIFCKFNFYWGK